MPDFPLLKLSTPEPYTIRAQRGGGADISRPSRHRQGARLDPRFESLSRVASNPTEILTLRNDPSSIAPERAIVFEVEGSLKDFYQQAHAIGLEYLGDFEDEFASSDDFYDKDDDEKDLNGRIYLAMPDVQSLRELLSLWNRYKQNIRMPKGKGPWRELFSRLMNVRPWGPQDRIPFETLSAWKEDLERVPSRPVRMEIELWFHEDATRRSLAFQQVQTVLNSAGGTIFDHAIFPEIRYDGILAEAPVQYVQSLTENENVSLAVLDEVMFLRPQSIFKQPIPTESQGEHNGTQNSAPQFVNNAPIVALLDGLPIQNHARLSGRLNIDDPDGLDAAYPVNARVHGTAMASLIIHGDLNQGEAPIKRPLYVRPILAPNTQGEEMTPPNRLLVDVIYQAIRRIKAGNEEEEATAPTVLAINFSLGDIKRPFARVMSPLGRLLDYLAYRYNLLFLISAGNILERLPVQGFTNWSDFETASPEDREKKILSSLNAQKSQRTLLSPAECMNALTIGAAHKGSAFNGTLPTGQLDPFTDDGLPNIASAMGLGFKKVIKPELLFPGGRTPVMFASSGTELQVRPPTAGARNYGLKTAFPSPLGRITYEDFTWGTSCSTALATRAVHLIHDSLLDTQGGDPGTLINPNYLPIVLKALLVHGAQWCPRGEFLDSFFMPQGTGSHFIRRDDIARLLGYGVPSVERVLACTANRATLLGYGTITPGNALLYRIPLPSGLDGRRAFRALTLTLAWFSPVNPRHQGYRMASLDISSASEEKYWIASQRDPYQPTDKAVSRGTVYHERRVAEEAQVFIDNGQILLRISCRSTAGEFADVVPYALAVTFEVAIEAGIQVYQEIREKLVAPVPATISA
ncbi:MAG: hypothetical protein OJF47_003864 [Nitrospira sp.]|jgi:hypothetical protein|nr:MAG: hypothetical protein OJF47_003864 [Nitrospira sp.]